MQMQNENKIFGKPFYLQDIWRITDKPQTIESIREADKTNYITDFVSAIKLIGRQTLGPEIIAVAKYKDLDPNGKRVSLDDIFNNYPSLAKALEEGLITKQDVETGIKKIKYLEHLKGFVDVTCLLPGNIGNQELAYGNRIPIIKAVFEPYERSHDQATEVKRNKKIWRALANYFQLKIDFGSLNTFEDLLKIIGSNKVIIPLNFTSKEYYFRVEEPSIDIGTNKRPSGHINIQAASLFIKDEHGSRIILIYYIGKKWNPETWSHIKNKIITPLEQSIEQAVEIETTNLKFPFQGGRADGN